MIKRTLKHHGIPFLKYALVGVSGTILDVGLFTLLVAVTPLGETLLGHIIAATITFTIAVSNNYFWNSRWTFKEHARRDKKQFFQFFLVSIIGWALNTFFLTVFSTLFIHLFSTLTPLLSALAKICASGIVLIYNFLMNRFWTFKKRS